MCRRDAPSGFRACAPCQQAVTAIRRQSLTSSHLRRCALRLPILLRGPLPQWQCTDYAPACCGRLCGSVPSPTLAVQRNHVTKGSSPTRRPASLLWSFHTTPQACGRELQEGRSDLIVGALTWFASGRKPVQASRGNAELSRSPFGAVRPKASLCRCESWRWPGCASGFLTATVRRKQFPLRWAHSSRDKLFASSGSSLRCDRKRCSQSVPRRSDHNKDAMGANLV